MPATDTGLIRDTIAAIATPPGRGGIGIVRLSGPAAVSIAQSVVSLSSAPLQPSQARFCHLVEPVTGQRLDEAVVTYFQAPRSYTGEDVVEIAAHGAPVLLDHLLRLLLAQGARLAEPGEFTERAFLCGRLDLTQAEAVRDLIDAQTMLQAQVAAQQLGGSLSRRIAPLKHELVALIAMLEAGIDFAEDDTPVMSDTAIASRLLQLQQKLLQIDQSFELGRLLSEGVTVAIVGRPNAGKSSLFNRLLKTERAIVTAEPGTTRDTVQERLALGGIPVALVDTAGLREAAGEAERIGIAKSREAFADAGLILLVLDSTQLLNAEEEALLEAAAGRPLLIALNKCDLPATGSQPPLDLLARHSSAGRPGPQTDEALLAFDRLRELAPAAPTVLTSALTGEGFEALRTTAETLLLGRSGVAIDSAMLTSLRQHTAVAAARKAVNAAEAANSSSLPHELLLLDLYNALHELDTLTGSTVPDDILKLIFSTFCIGK